MTMTFDTHLTSLTHLFKYLKKFEAYGRNSFQIVYNFHFCPCNSLSPKLASNRSRSTQGDNLNNLNSTRVHNATYQIQGHQSIGYGKEDF